MRVRSLPATDLTAVRSRRLSGAGAASTLQLRAGMPYDNISDLPKSQVDQYSHHQKEAFLEAFNNAYKEYGGDESRAFAVAHSAAQRAPKKDPHPND